MPETFSYTGKRVADEVKNQFGDTGNVLINDGLILNWINNGIRSIATTATFNEKVFVTNILASQGVYDLNALMSSDRVQSYSAVVVNGYKVDVIEWPAYQRHITNRQRGEDTGDNALIASDYGGKLSIWPVPTESVVQGLAVYYIGWPADLVAINDALTVPDRYYNALVAYVLAKAFEKGEQFEAANQQLQQHSDGAALEMQRNRMNPTDFYPHISTDGLEDYI